MQLDFDFRACALITRHALSRVRVMEVLVEFKGNKIPFNPRTSSELVKLIELEVKEHDADATVSFGIGASESKYVLRRWSPKWACYVSLKSVDDIVDGDKLLVDSKPDVSVSFQHTLLTSVVIEQLRHTLVAEAGGLGAGL